MSGFAFRRETKAKLVCLLHAWAEPVSGRGVCVSTQAARLALCGSEGHCPGVAVPYSPLEQLPWFADRLPPSHVGVVTVSAGRPAWVMRK